MGVAAAGLAPGIATKLFGYNRENFQEDREQRMKKEFKERNYRVCQAALWREDVRSFVSLTEQKMSLYLIVNVLLLSFTVSLWVEGQLPESTPDWLVMGYQVSCVVAFSFHLLTIWLSMHASIAAKSYQTRVLTQLVRLPIPTWSELEACRTAGSEFEKMESRQMFRVPFVTGKQESFVAGNTASQMADAEAAGVSRSEASAEESKEALATDPWGLERRGDDVYELDNPNPEEISELRHMKLMRQAAVYWQTYDAFARVSMSVGINQLMLGMSYYILGYALLELKAVCASLAGVVAFMGSAEVILRVDLTLPPNSQRLVQCLVAVGPIISFAAAYVHSFGKETSKEFAELLAPLAYISNGVAIGCMTFFLKVDQQANGAMIPNAFKSVLYLDIFGWLTHKSGEGEVMPSGYGSKDLVTSTASDINSSTAKPSANGIKYDKYGRALPVQAADTGPAGSLEDLRYVHGAPRAWDEINAIEPAYKEFWDPVTFMPPESRERGTFDELLAEDTSGYHVSTGQSPIVLKEKEKDSTPIETGHDNEQPGELPWRIFRNLALATIIFWITAGVMTFLVASSPALVEMGMAFEEVIEEGKEAHESELEKIVPEETKESDKHRRLAGHMSLSALFSNVSTADTRTLKSNNMQQIEATWPYPGFQPKGLSCDERGMRLLVTDGMSTYTAELQFTASNSSDKMRLRATPAPADALSASFKQVSDCSPLLGEKLQDTALSCSGNLLSTCKALVLHGQGGRVTACDLSQAGGRSFQVASSWISAARSPGPAGRGSVTTPTEKASFLLTDPSCSDMLGPGCMSVGTSLGRSARMQVGSRGDDLLPLDVSEISHKEEGNPDGMRAISERYLGLLRTQDNAIDVLDLDRGGRRSAKLSLGLPAPVQDFCLGRDHLYLLTSGKALFRASIPEQLKIHTETP